MYINNTKVTLQHFFIFFLYWALYGFDGHLHWENVLITSQNVLRFVRIHSEISILFHRFLKWSELLPIHFIALFSLGLQSKFSLGVNIESWALREQHLSHKIWDAVWRTSAKASSLRWEHSSFISRNQPYHCLCLCSDDSEMLNKAPAFSSCSYATSVYILRHTCSKSHTNPAEKSQIRHWRRRAGTINTACKPHRIP